MDDRKLAVLRAIVEDYVATNEPVGSKVLAERHGLGVSSATIRNDMGALEEEGYISAPHTSAGRIPTDKGYRLFVDRLSTIKPLSSAERRAIQSFLDESVDLHDVMARSVRLLSQLTKQVALVQYPSLDRSAIRHIEFVPVSTTRILIIVIADTSRIEQRTVDLPNTISDQTLSDLRLALNALLDGKLFSEVPDVLAGFVEQHPIALRPTVAVIVSTLLESVVTKHEERVVVGGTANIARGSRDFGQSAGQVLEALEEHVVLLKLFGNVRAIDSLQVQIGHENQVEELRTASVVSAGYGTGDQAVANIGVIGPTRMDYPTSMSAVRAVATYVGQILKEQTGV